jgi:hypothetical protein
MRAGIGVGIPFSNPKPKLIAFDSFNRADAATLGKADTGQTWEQLIGASVVSISGGQAFLSGGATENVSVLDTKAANYEIGVTVSNLLNNAGIVFRIKSSGQYYLLRLLASSKGIELLRNGTESTAGAFVSLVSKTAINEIAAGSTNRIKVVCNGAKMEAYLNGVKQFEIDDNTFSSYTKVGFRSGSSDYTTKYDNFEVKQI